jgi:hypothetical protein
VSESGAEAIWFEIRTARRLARLFRIERRGGFDRRPAAIIGRLIERRGALVAALVATDLRRRAVAVRPTAGLDQAIAALSGEVRRALPCAQRRLEQIGKDLRLSRGEGWSTGILDSGGTGQPLGRS